MNRLVLMVLAFSFAFGGRLCDAAEGSAALAPADEVSSENSKFSENQDITDSVLKANAGSLSHYSLRFNFSYSGPPLGDLEAKDQPNPDGTVAVTATALTGSFGGRYRFDSKSSLSLTAGLSDQYIFHEGQRADINNPFLSYDRALQAFGIQMVSSVGAALITTSTLRAVSEVSSLNYSLSSIYEFGTSGLALGLDGTLAYYFFSRAWMAKDGKVRQENIGFNPSVKYNVNDKLNVYTGLGFAFWNPRSETDRGRLLAKTTTQKWGLGYAFTRDIYFTPFISSFPEKIALDMTTINFNTIFSLF